MKSFVLVMVVMLSLLFMCNFSLHAKEAKILAIVDNEIISNLDLDRREDLLKQISTTELGKRENLLQYLIDEHLFFKYAKDLNVVVTDAEVNDAIQSLGVKIANLDYKELFTQIKARMIWNKIISQYVLPVTSVSAHEVDDYIRQSLLLKETVNLVKQVEIIPGTWEEIKIGWVNIKALEPKIRAIVEKLHLDELSSIFNEDGKATQFKVIDVENDHVLKAHFKIRKVEANAENYNDEYCNTGTVDIKGSDLSLIIRENLLSIKENQLSKVIKERINGEDFEYKLVLCDSSIKRDVHQHIFMSKIEEGQKKYLTTLRENSFIEIKV